MAFFGRFLATSAVMWSKPGDLLSDKNICKKKKINNLQQMNINLPIQVEFIIIGFSIFHMYSI